VPPRARHDIADDVQSPMKKVIGTGNDDDRKIQRVCPGKHVGERDRFIACTVDDDRVTGDGLSFVLTRTFNVAGGSTDQYQSLRRMIGLGQRLSDA
jgi:hypothetical protein